MNNSTEHTPAMPVAPAAEPLEPAPQKPISMHEGVPVWCDCCSCAAEPYWREVAQEMGIDLDA